MASHVGGLGFEGYKSSGGYDFEAELSRYQFPSVSIGSASINRGTCRAGISGTSTAELVDQARAEVIDTLLPTTLRLKDPSVADISRPVVGHYQLTPAGTIFDAYIGVGQRLIDENHPRLRNLLVRLAGYNGLLRREAATNELVVADPSSGIVTPQQLAGTVTSLAAKAFPGQGKYRAYLCSSGAEAIEAAMKIACLEAYNRLRKKYGDAGEASLMAQLRIPRDDSMNHPEDRSPLYADYPFYFVTTQGGFHGRTLGALSLSSVRPVNKRGFPAFYRVARIEFNGDPNSLDRLLDLRPLGEVLATPGGLEAVLSKGRIPRELVAGLVVEPFQGEGGYRPADQHWIRSVASACRTHSIAVIADEIQTFARTGRVFAFEHLGVEPDIVALSKASVVGMTLASGRFSSSLGLGWHSTTWGGGKVLDNNFAWEVIDTYVNYRDPHFGMSYIENQACKAEYIQAAFERLGDRHPKIFSDFRGLGGMWGFSVKHRDDVCAAARRRGLKLLSCGVTREISSIRALFLADVLTKEVNCFARLLDIALRDASQ